MQMLQRLYDDLRAVHPAKRRPSGLTVVDNYDADTVKHAGGSSGGWCVTWLPASSAAECVFPATFESPIVSLSTPTSSSDMLQFTCR